MSKFFDPRKKFSTSKKKEEEGVVVDLGDGAKIKIRRQSYPPAAEFLRKSMRPHRKSIDAGTMAETVAEKIVIDCLVDHLLVSWEGFFDPVWQEGKAPKYDPKTGEITEEGVQAIDDQGKPLYQEVKFSKPAARKLFKDLPELRSLVWDYTNSADLFRKEEEEEDAKN